MFRDFFVPFLDGLLAGLAYHFVSGNLFGINVVALIPLPQFASSAIVFGILVLIIDYILRDVIRL